MNSRNIYYDRSSKLRSSKTYLGDLHLNSFVKVSCRVMYSNMENEKRDKLRASTYFDTNWQSIHFGRHKEHLDLIMINKTVQNVSTGHARNKKSVYFGGVNVFGLSIPTSGGFTLSLPCQNIPKYRPFIADSCTATLRANVIMYNRIREKHGRTTCS